MSGSAIISMPPQGSFAEFEARSGRSHVVCGTDFSDAGRDAADVAAEVARHLSIPLALVHAVNEPARGSLPGELRESLALFQRRQLAEEVQRLTAGGVAAQEHLESGAPEDVILQTVQEPGTRLLVLSCGQRKAKGEPLGSVVEHVVEHVSVPALIVRAASPLLSWLRGHRTLRVFVAAELTPSAEAAIHWASDLRALGPCELTIAHVEAEPAAAYETESACSSSLLASLATLRRSTARVFRDYVKRVLRGQPAKIRVVPGWGRSDAHLIHLAQEVRADLIVTGTSLRRGAGRLLHYSVSRGLLHYAPVNVACVPLPQTTPATMGLAS